MAAASSSRGRSSQVRDNSPRVVQKTATRSTLVAAQGAEDNSPFVVREFGRIDGEVRSLRNAIRDLQKKAGIAVDTSEQTRQTRDLAELQRQLAALQQQWHSQQQHFQSYQSQQQQFQSQQQQLLSQHQQVAAQQQQLQSQAAQSRKELEQLADEQRATRALAREVEELKRQAADLPRMQSELSKSRQALQTELATLRRELEPMRSEKDLAKAVQKEVNRLGRELEPMKSLDVGTMKAVLLQTSRDFQELRRQIYQSGVLMPKREPPPTEEQVPVGTLELGEDIFAARLLVKLGFLAGAQRRAADAEEAAEKGEAEEVSEMSGLSDLPKFEDWVSGLVEPEIEIGGPGYFSVTTGWLIACCVVMFVQVLIVVVLIKHNFQEIGDACMEEALTPAKWWILHLAKSSATLVAGILSALELMDTVNYWMVSRLLEPNGNLEATISASVRVATIALIGLANALAFRSTFNATDIFMNMTALTFVGEIGKFVLDVAKRGVLGHYICKTMTEVNFQLNLNREYPEWFQSVRTVTLTLVITVTVAFSAFLFLLPDPLCQEAVANATDAPSIVASGVAAAIAGGATHHGK